MSHEEYTRKMKVKEWEQQKAKALRPEYEIELAKLKKKYYQDIDEVGDDVKVKVEASNKWVINESGGWIYIVSPNGKQSVHHKTFFN